MKTVIKTMIIINGHVVEVDHLFIPEANQEAFLVVQAETENIKSEISTVIKTKDTTTSIIRSHVTKIEIILIATISMTRGEGDITV